MATRINLLDRAPQFVISGLNWVLAPFENPTGLARPLWRDISRYQGYVDFDIMAASGVYGVAMRQGISWGYQDPKFAEYWERSQDVIPYRTSYHVIYPDQPVRLQWEDNWRKYHPVIDVIPRVIDLELQQSTAPAVIANQVWEMSERVSDHDGVRPIIYSRYLLVNDWLSKYWSATMLNEHYWHLAQYLTDRVREHPGPPTLPNGVDESRVILHQTADKKATPTGEAESASIDWDRWEIGNADQMHWWIADAWGGNVIEPPLPDPELERRVIELETRVSTIESWIVQHDQDHEIPIEPDPEPLPDPDTIKVSATEKIALAIPVGHDKACEGCDPPGKPILEPPTYDRRVVVAAYQTIDVRARAAYSCKDDPDTPEILATGGIPYYIVADGQPGAGQFCRKDKTTRV